MMALLSAQVGRHDGQRPDLLTAQPVHSHFLPNPGALLNRILENTMST